MISREEYIKNLQELLVDDPSMAKGRDEEVIYQIGDLTIYGGFEMGVRGTDHRSLLFEGVSWENIMNWGTVVVPETQSYISDQLVDQFEKLGFKNLPTNDNHLRGFKDVTEISELNTDKKELLDSQNVESPGALFLTEKTNKFEQRKAAAVEKNKMIERNMDGSLDKQVVNEGRIMK